MEKRKVKKSKFKIYPSFLILLLVCFAFNKIGILINYLLALSFHELSHLIVAEIKGYSLNQFRLDIFGASIDLDNYVDDKDVFMINIAGPLGNICLCILCLALYYIFPQSYLILNNFCIANLALAVFNMLPIYPLDGGKVFGAMFKNERKKKIFNLIMKILLFTISLIFFVVEAVYGWFNIIPLLLAIFILTTKSETKYSFTLFKNKEFKTIQSVLILRINREETIIGALKQVKKNHYTIFYLNDSKRFYDEDYLIELALKHGPNTRLGDIA